MSSGYQAYGSNSYGSTYAVEQDYYTAVGGAAASSYQSSQAALGADRYQSSALQRSDTSNSEATFMQQSAGTAAQPASSAYKPEGFASVGTSNYQISDQGHGTEGHNDAYNNTYEAASSSLEGYPATVIFDFTAEQENELTVRVGDEVVVGAEIDGWYQTTRVRDGVSGLIPASYAKLLQE
jgi:hypothetical protein